MGDAPTGHDMWKAQAATTGPHCVSRAIGAEEFNHLLMRIQQCQCQMFGEPASVSQAAEHIVMILL